MRRSEQDVNALDRPTIGADFVCCESSVDGSLVTRCLLSTRYELPLIDPQLSVLGHRRLLWPGQGVYRGSDALILVFDITNRQSFLPGPLENAIFGHGVSRLTILVLGNKLDQEASRQVKLLMYTR